MYATKENVFMVDNHKKHGDYYENPSLSHLMDKLCFKGKWWKKSVSCQTKATISYIPMSRK